jgi:hypothetical protein
LEIALIMAVLEDAGHLPVVEPGLQIRELEPMRPVPPAPHESHS